MPEVTTAPRVPPATDEVASFPGRLLGPWHTFWRSSSGFVLWRFLVGVFGSFLVIVGLALVPLPGPGWLVVFAGLAVLGLEFAFARSLLTFARSKVSAWSGWALSRPLPLRVLLGALSLLVAMALALALGWFFGAYQWLPAFVGASLAPVLPAFS